MRRKYAIHPSVGMRRYAIHPCMVRIAAQSLRSHRPSHSVSRYVATDPRTSRSLRIDRSSTEQVAT
ncbi:hypothetical protein DY000_02016254 [Brassica cretica]|uniref:Uncharacterized protein n=1 Tax=Brassica cretica TaxID=69181 RepID=A0ABQ7D410_BRACR|nr:hypothetical protein DY000_02016254 [Brassica cretica]